jgi:thiopeptide-type bacteriocin biosynthesis protein
MYEWLGAVWPAAPTTPAPPPRSVDLYCALAATSASALDAGHFLLVVTGNGLTSPAGRAFGRFAELLDANSGVADPGMREHLRELINTDVPSGAIAAELTFEPLRAQAANVMVRPEPAYAIPINGATPPRARTIPIHELAVVAQDERLRLVWLGNGAEVIAAYWHMLNPRLAPPLAQFLFAVSHDGQLSPLDKFFWGSAEHLPFRPRIQVGRVVLARAGWSLDAPFFQEFARDPITARNRAGLPRHVLLGNSDEQLMLDVESRFGSRLLATAGRKLRVGEQLHVQEALPGPDDTPLVSADGQRGVELVVPVVREGDPSAVYGSKGGFADLVATSRNRSRRPGSDWLYAKLYVPQEVADDLIAGPVRRLAERLCTDGHAEFWYFVRYHDPAFHLRVRFHGSSTGLWEHVFPALTRWTDSLASNGMIGRLVLDTYEREIERYGGSEAMPLVERIFAADSAAVASMMADRQAIRSIERIHLVARTVDDLLASFGYDPAQRLRWYRANRAVRSPAESTMFRADKDRLRKLMAPGVATTQLAAVAATSAEICLVHRHENVVCIIEQLQTLEHSGRLHTPMPAIVASIMHMHINRWFTGGVDIDRRVFALASLILASLLEWPPDAN